MLSNCKKVERTITINNLLKLNCNSVSICYKLVNNNLFVINVWQNEFKAEKCALILFADCSKIKCYIVKCSMT